MENNIKTLDFLPPGAVLVVDVNVIPDNMTFTEYLEVVNATGTVFYYGDQGDKPYILLQEGGKNLNIEFLDKSKKYKVDE